MTAEQELITLLLECTPTQQDFFKRLYPNMPTKEQISNATMQVKRTIEKNKIDYYNQEKITKIQTELETSNNQIQDLIIKNKELENENKDIKLELAEIKLANTANSSDDKKRLLLLNALESAGVDNWEWYSEAIDIYEKNLLSIG